jgi:hypothetical protein
MGEGSTKKIAKREAAGRMLTRVKNLSEEEKQAMRIR